MIDCRMDLNTLKCKKMGLVFPNPMGFRSIMVLYHANTSSDMIGKTHKMYCVLPEVFNKLFTTNSMRPASSTALKESLNTDTNKGFYTTTTDMAFIKKMLQKKVIKGKKTSKVTIISLPGLITAMKVLKCPKVMRDVVSNAYQCFKGNPDSIPKVVPFINNTSSSSSAPPSLHAMAAPPPSSHPTQSYGTAVSDGHAQSFHAMAQRPLSSSSSSPTSSHDTEADAERVWPNKIPTNLEFNPCIMAGKRYTLKEGSRTPKMLADVEAFRVFAQDPDPNIDREGVFQSAQGGNTWPKQAKAIWGYLGFLHTQSGYTPETLSIGCYANIQEFFNFISFLKHGRGVESTEIKHHLRLAIRINKWLVTEHNYSLEVGGWVDVYTHTRKTFTHTQMLTHTGTNCKGEASGEALLSSGPG